MSLDCPAGLSGDISAALEADIHGSCGTRLLLAGHLQPQALLEGSVFVDGVITFPVKQSAKYA